MAIGVVLQAPTGVQQCYAQQLPRNGCNNEAELHALIHGLEAAAQAHAVALRIYTDSQWLVQQLQGGGLHHPTARLAVALEQARLQLQRLGSVQWRWIPRHHNLQADALARAQQ
jgi:ribonuclease HI